MLQPEFDRPAQPVAVCSGGFVRWVLLACPRAPEGPPPKPRVRSLSAERGDDLAVSRLGESLQCLGPHAAEHSEHQAEPRRHGIVWRLVNTDEIVLAERHVDGLE